MEKLEDSIEAERDLVDRDRFIKDYAKVTRQFYLREIPQDKLETLNKLFRLVSIQYPEFFILDDSEIYDSINPEVTFHFSSYSEI